MFRDIIGESQLQRIQVLDTEFFICLRLRPLQRKDVFICNIFRTGSLVQFRLRGPTGEHDEFLLAANVQNLRKLTRYAQTLKQTDYAPCLNTKTEK